MKLAIVLPCYNEEAVVEDSFIRLREVLNGLVEKGKLDPQSTLCFVDDGSKDATWTIIERLSRENENVCGVKLSRNYGHQNALLAGMFSVDADAVVTMDVDLQDDLHAIEKMLDAHARGFKVVYGVKTSREVDSSFKKWSAQAFYRIMAWMGVDIVYNHADCRLLDKKVVEHLKEFREVNLFLRGIVPLLGFPSTIVEYELSERKKGASKYSLRKMFSFAWNGITSFSIFPLRLISYTGFVIFVGSLALTAWAFWVKYFTNDAIPGWASTVLPIYFIGGIQVLSLGIIGEYIGKIYLETKSRPRFIIEKRVHHGD